MSYLIGVTVYLEALATGQANNVIYDEAWDRLYQFQSLEELKTKGQPRLQYVIEHQ